MSQPDQSLEQVVKDANASPAAADAALNALGINVHLPVHYGIAAHGSGGGSGYEVSPEHVEDVIKAAKEERVNIRRAIQTVQPITEVQGPAPDEDGSQKQARATREAGTIVVDNLRAAANQVDELIHEYETAKAEYLHQEHLTEQQWQSLAKGL